MPISEQQERLRKLMADGYTPDDIIRVRDSMKDDIGQPFLFSKNPAIGDSALAGLGSPSVGLTDAELNAQQPITSNGDVVRTDVEMSMVNYQDPKDVSTPDKKDETLGFVDTMGAAIQSEWVEVSAGRMYERSQIDADPDWTMDEITSKSLMNSHTKREYEYLKDASSADELNWRLADVDKTRQREIELSKLGMLGVGARTAASIFDPAMWLLTASTAGVGAVPRLGRIGNIVRGAGIAGAEGAALEAFLMQNDSSRNWDDVVIAGLTAGVLGGGLSIPSANRMAKSQQKQLLEAQRVKAVEDSINAVKVARRSGLESDIKKWESIGETESVRLRDSLDEYLIRSDVKVKEGLLSTEGIKYVATRKMKLEAELRDLEDMRAANEDGLWADVEGDLQNPMVSSSQALNKLRYVSARVDNTSIELNNKIDDILYELGELESVQKADSDAYATKVELAEVKAIVDDPDKLWAFFFPKVDRVYSKEEVEVLKSRLKDDKIEESWFVPKEVSGTEQSNALDTSTDIATGNAGAMKTRRNPIYEETRLANEAEEAWMDNAIDAFQTYNSTFGDQYTKGIPTWMLGDYSKLQDLVKKEPNIRALAHAMFENPQGPADGYTVSILAYTYDKLIRRAGRNSMDAGYNDYLKEQGINNIKGNLSVKTRANFEKTVALEIKGLLTPSQSSDAIKKAAKGAADQFAEALRLRREHGELGFEDVEADANYLPDLHSRDKYNKLLKSGFKQADLEALISKGYLEGKNGVTKAQADLLANLKVTNMMTSNIMEGDGRAIFTVHSKTSAKKMMDDAGVPMDIQDRFFEEIMSAEDWATISNRARKSMKINWSSSYEANAKPIYGKDGSIVGYGGGTKFTVADLMETNTSKLLESYTQESAAGAAFAQKGIHSEGMFNRLLEEAKRSGVDSIDKGADFTAADLDRAISILRNGRTMIQGKPVVDYHGKHGKTNKAGRMLLDATGILRLQQVGFAQIPEIARVMQSVGIREFIKGVPGSNTFRNPFKGGAGRDKNFELKAAEMRDVEEWFGYVGELEMGQAFNVRGDDIGSEATGRIASAIDATLEGARRVSQVANGFSTIQGGLEKVGARALSNRMRDYFVNGRPLTARMKDQVKRAGMSEGRMKEISDWMKANPKTQYDDNLGREVRLWNIDAMPNDIRTDVNVMMQRLQNQNVTRGLVGESSSEWFGPWARFFTQFRSYSLVSLEKQMMAGVRGDKAIESTLFLASTGMAYAAYMSQIYVRASGMPSDEREDYIDKMTSQKAVTWGVFNKHPQLAGLGIASDIGLLTGAMPREVYDTSRFGFQQGDIMAFVPAAGVVEDTLRTGLAGADLVFDRFREDATMEDSIVEFWRRARRVLPLTGLAGLGELTKPNQE